MAKRLVKIHRSGWRPHLMFGADREMVIMTGGIAIVLCVLVGPHGLQFVALGVALWVVSLFCLRLMAKADPLMRHVYVRNRTYQKYYPPRSQPWRVNRPGQNTPFSKK